MAPDPTFGVLFLTGLLVFLIVPVSSFSFLNSTWDKNSLTYAFLPDNALPNTTKAVFARALEWWARVIPVNFSENPYYSGADIQIGFYRGEHGDGSPFDGPLGILAHSLPPPIGRLHRDLDEDWVVTDISQTRHSRRSFDMESVALHELGHVLGLDHSTVKRAVMFPTISVGQRKVDLSRDDIDGIQRLYGANPSYNGSATNGCEMSVDIRFWDIMFLSTLVSAFFICDLFLHL